MSLTPTEKKTGYEKDTGQEARPSKKKRLSLTIQKKLALGLPLTAYEKAVWEVLSTLEQEDQPL